MDSYKILILLLILILIYQPKKIINKVKIEKKEIIGINNKIQEKPIGRLEIKKINLIKPIYKETSRKNNVEENITILNGSISPEESNSIFFLAAHSGSGPIAFFNNLDQLTEGDQVILIYKNNHYQYIVKNKWNQRKDGTIHVPKEKENQLILTTCSKDKKGYQFIINCIKKS